MAVFFLSLGIIAFIIGLVLLIAGILDERDGEGQVLSGFLLIAVGLVCGIGGAIHFPDDTPTQQVEVIAPAPIPENLVRADSIYAIEFVISWKEEGGVRCGTDVKLLGHTEKDIGDTIVIRLK